jgi:hypothetical protein
MMKHARLNHQFVEYIPETIKTGVLYVSITFATAVHKCCCGCGLEVVTPFTPTDWRITFDGETVSLSPSIGNWNFPCRSHYIIDRGRVLGARSWSEHQVAAERQRDRRAKAGFYAARSAAFEAPVAPVNESAAPNREGLWSTIKRWWHRA